MERVTSHINRSDKPLLTAMDGIENRLELYESHFNDLMKNANVTNLFFLLMQCCSAQQIIDFMSRKASLEECVGKNTWVVDLLTKNHSFLEEKTAWIGEQKKHYLPEFASTILSQITKFGKTEDHSKSIEKLYILLNKIYLKTQYIDFFTKDNMKGGGINNSHQLLQSNDHQGKLAGEDEVIKRELPDFGEILITKRSVDLLEFENKKNVGSNKEKFLFRFNQEQKLDDIACANRLEPTQGFAGLGNTCYANSAMKMLIMASGASNLYSHLEKVVEHNNSRIVALKNVSTNDYTNKELDQLQKNNAAINAFLAVIIDSCVGSEPLDSQLETFFDLLQLTAPFSKQIKKGKYEFPIIGIQQDPNEFLLKLSEVFLFDKMKGSEITKVTSKQDINNPSRKDDFPHSSHSWALESNVYEDMTLGNMFNDFLRGEEVALKWGNDEESTRTWKTQSFELDTNPNSFDSRLFHHINALSFDVSASKLKLTLTNFNEPVSFECRDRNDKKRYKVTLAAQQIIIHKGSSANSGHYIIYNRSDRGNNWVVHDDANIYEVDHVSRGVQAKFVNYKIVAREEIIEEQDNEVI